MLHGTPEVRAMPIVVVTSDKRFDFGAGGPETWPAWRSAQDRLAKVLNAKHVSDTNSGHAIQMAQPQLVTNAIRQVVEAVRSESHQLSRTNTEAKLPSIPDGSRFALEKALDAAFTKSGLPGVITGLWIPGTWIASRGVSDLRTKAPMTAELQAPIQREHPSGRVISLGHAGSEAGYSANVQYYPCTGAVWALMTNGDCGTGEAFIPALKALQPIVEPLAVPSEKCAP
jgi:hypothetical protein